MTERQGEASTVIDLRPGQALVATGPVRIEFTARFDNRVRLTATHAPEIEVRRERPGEHQP